MKRMMKFGLALFFLVFVAPVWAHHAAEGIISDDVWARIDDQLVAIDSPHLNIDFDDVMGTMSSVTIDGRVYLQTTITVEVEEAAEYVDLIEQAIDDALAESVDAGMAPDGVVGTGNSRTFEIEIIEWDDDSGYVDILLLEPLGQGNAQEDPDTPPPQNGQRAGG